MEITCVSWSFGRPLRDSGPELARTGGKHEVRSATYCTRPRTACQMPRHFERGMRHPCGTRVNSEKVFLAQMTLLRRLFQVGCYLLGMEERRCPRRRRKEDLREGGADVPAPLVSACATWHDGF